MSDGKIGVGLVGLVGLNAGGGWAARSHVAALRALPDYELVAVANSSLESAEVAAAEFGVPGAYADVAALGRDPAVDLIIVSVKVPYHRALVEPALAASKMV